MSDYNLKLLIDNIDRVHTTRLGMDRIKRNLNMDCPDPVAYCIDIIKNEKSVVSRNGKNYYVTLGNIRLTINAYSYTIITAHIIK